jgi:hypothetical protein
MVAIQNPSAFSKGALEIDDAFYDIRSGYNGTPAGFSIAGYGGALPISIQNMPDEQRGAIYGSGDGSFTFINYQTEKSIGSASGLQGPSSSIFETRSGGYVFAANQQAHLFTVVNQSAGAAVSLNLPGVYRVSVNQGGSMALAFVQNSDYAYYPLQLNTEQGISYSGGPSTWPLGAADCEPQNAPTWCLMQMLDPSSTAANPKPLVFNRPVKAVFSADGGTAYILSCGPECGGNVAPTSGFPATAAVTPVPVAPMLFPENQASGLLPTQAALNSATIAIAGGASNSLVDSSTMYVVGQQPEEVVNGVTLFGGNLTVVNLSNNSITSQVAISDGQPGATSRMILADDNTLWIGMQGCTNGVRYASNSATGYGCLTMYNTSVNTVTLLEPYLGDATGIAAVTGLHKVYTAEGGQVYIYSTVNGTNIDNQFVTVTGTAYDVAYMDAVTDGDNTVY